MGNCLTREDSSWADEDWGSLVSSTHRQGDDDNLPDGGNTREVKITLSKKELQRLVHDMDVQGLTLEQGLARMVDCGDVYEAEVRRTWKPVLQSIPEVN
ncbi:F11F12.2-like protein [Hibiscus syriacus]|uniref:F11F12.2-like protein n=1 Tax=Hibiscus syriacus TaxID=106335 RepID=A0A6A2XUA1_HIBSY|nr:F11F12.2-like protein [Hibiscus syriacus]